MYLYGGSKDGKLLNDVVKYDIIEQKFFRVRIDDEESIPLAREFHQAAIVNDS